MPEEDAAEKMTVQVEGNTGNSHRETRRNRCCRSRKKDQAIVHWLPRVSRALRRPWVFHEGQTSSCSGRNGNFDSIHKEAGRILGNREYEAKKNEKENLIRIQRRGVSENRWGNRREKWKGKRMRVCC